jgi:N-acetyl sugar amidotransferase
MDTSDVDITFNEEGICNHCIKAEETLKSAWFPNELGKKKLDDKAREIREYGKGRKYDCIIGMSGGVDSSYLLHVAVKIMNLRPLVVHVDGGWNTETAVRNIEKMVSKLGLELFTYVVDWNEMQDLQLSFLKSSIANQDTPQDHAFFAKLYEFAIKNKIRYVLTGANLTSESILPKSWGYNPLDKIHLNDIHRKFGKRKLRTFPKMGFSQQYIMWPYIKRMKIVTPLNWINYNKNEAMKFLEENYSWQYYGGKHLESVWTKFFQCYYLPVKFGYDKRKAHLSSLIVSNQLKRDEALEILKEPPYDKKDVEEDLRYVSKKLGITKEEIIELIKFDNKTYKDYKNLEAFFLYRLLKHTFYKFKSINS